MTQYLPPNLLALFAPRDALPFLPPPDKLPHEKKTRGYMGVGSFLSEFENPDDTPPPTRIETREERMERRRKEKSEQVAYKLEREIAMWDPSNIESATEDPFKTLFVARINFDTSESKLRREFEVHGPIKKIVVAHNSETSKPRGYAFIEYEHERDMHSAYKYADGKKIDGKRVLVDVERARTVKGWLPRRLGGGLGGTRRGGADVNIKHSGREDNERERERYRLEREREDRRGSGGGAGSDRGERFNNRRSRSPRIREREREPRRSRSRDRRKRRSRSRDDYERRSERDRSDRREKEKKRKRSRSRDRDRSERKRDKRDKERDHRERKERKPDFRSGDIKIKEEPVDDYPDYSANYGAYGADVKYEEGEEEKYRPQEHEKPHENNGQGYSSHGNEDGEYDDRHY